MELKKILDALSENGLLRGEYEKFGNIGVLSVGCDSRKVTKGQLFFIKGAGFREEFLVSALEKGCCAVIGEEERTLSVPYVRVSDVRASMPVCANVFYDHPASKFPLVGITGTKGKTTCAYMLRNIFEEAFGNNVGMISTVEATSCGRSIPKSGTTPEALELYSILNNFALDGVKAACMEVSSQGLAYNRVDGIDFFVGAFLNLGEDHISPTEHHSFEEYKAAKMRLMTLCRHGVVNIDDAAAPDFLKAATCETMTTIGIDSVCDLRAAIASAALCGICAESVRKGLSETKIPGRMEIVEEKGITVIVDYAHNELSFESVFNHIEKFYPKSKVICLFGCQGNKALDRRTQLPQVVGHHADFAVITTDDPENEDPKNILDEVGAEMEKTPVPFVKIEDREKAVEFAIETAQNGDVVFLSGKGPETTQKVHGKTVPYKGDMTSALTALEKK